jgi:DNA-binding transcriptional ArsR family regulator
VVNANLGEDLRWTRRLVCFDLDSVASNLLALPSQDVDDVERRASRQGDGHQFNGFSPGVAGCVVKQEVMSRTAGSYELTMSALGLSQGNAGRDHFVLRARVSGRGLSRPFAEESTVLILPGALDTFQYFYDHRIMNATKKARVKTEDDSAQINRYADMFTAMGTESRLRIMRILLSAHPEGMVVGDIGSELQIAASTLSHHLDKLKNEGLVNVRRAGTYLWYSANTDALQELLSFLYAECCTRNKAITTLCG